MKHEIDKDNYASWLKSATTCRNLVFQGLDLTEDDALLAALPQAEETEDACVFLGCTFGKLLANAVRCHAFIFPSFPHLPYQTFRHSLYTPEELFAGYEAVRDYRQTKDWEIYLTFMNVAESGTRTKREVGLDEIMARRLHDNFIADEVEELLQAFTGPGKKGVVSIMGGHKTSRSSDAFSKIAHLARLLTIDGYLIVTGGGPGLMEAGNLGAYFAAWEDPAVLDAAISELKTANEYTHPKWLETAWDVRKKYPTPDLSRSRSLGVPTWFYGHEPPNLFATAIAKYFENSLREEGLLAIATHGVIFGEGSGGTLQEIFQDACQNYYDNYGFKSPMILFDEAYWNPAPASIIDGYPVYPAKALPAWPLLQGIAGKGNFSSLITLTSDPAVVRKAIHAFPSPWPDPSA